MPHLYYLPAKSIGAESLQYLNVPTLAKCLEVDSSGNSLELQFNKWKSGFAATCQQTAASLVEGTDNAAETHYFLIKAGDELHYVPAGKLTPDMMCDDKTITTNTAFGALEDGKASLVLYATAAANSIPFKGSDENGALDWKTLADVVDDESISTTDGGALIPGTGTPRLQVKGASEHKGDSNHYFGTDKNGGIGWQGACREEMVARKDSPIWQALGDGAGGFSDTLGNPYPPFAFNSGMGWEDVDRDEAESLGLELDEPVRVEPPSLAVSEEEVADVRGRFGNVFTDAMMDVIRAYNEERSDAAANTECHVVGHPCRIHDKAQGGEAAFVAKASYVGNADYEGYRQMTRVRTDALRKAEDQLSRIIDRRTQTRRYRNVEDLFAQARSVSRERLAQIAQGYNDTCAVHEAVAFITATPQIKDSAGHDVSFNRWLIDHYLFGSRRAGNTPKVDNLRELPRAVFAIRTRPPFRHVNRSGVEQFQYSISNPRTRAYVYCDSGVVSGWHIVHSL